MGNTNAEKNWRTYRERELASVTPILQKLGFRLDEVQVHTGGERFLMVGERDVGGGGYKLVLLGTRTKDGKRVVIKVSSDGNGIREIETERDSRETLRTLTFSYRPFQAPEEVLYTMHAPYRIFITEYIEQERPFLARPIEEQFALALDTFKAQESVHATTSSHARVIRHTFGIWRAREYLASLDKFIAGATRADAANTNLRTVLARAREYLIERQHLIEQYSGFLTHADFVPHNLRVQSGKVYLLDSASLHFGNKYESWARFLNFMVLYNRPLEEALAEYVANNRTPEESEALRLMRIYKLGTLLEYYAGTLSKTEGALRELNEKRMIFWLEVLTSLLDGNRLPDEHIATYRKERDALRSDEEKKRQEALH